MRLRKIRNAMRGNAKRGSEPSEPLVARIDKNQNVNFDEDCVLFARMVMRGYGDDVIQFTANPTYCRRFITVLVPQVIDTQPSFVLKIAYRVLSVYKSFVPLLQQFNMLKVIQACVDSGELELAQQVANRDFDCICGFKGSAETDTADCECNFPGFKIDRN